MENIFTSMHLVKNVSLSRKLISLISSICCRAIARSPKDCIRSACNESYHNMNIINLSFKKKI